ncbi:glycosyltransferase [Clostridium perfringens]|nr:glycosyltransferase [Clostridium perfringens]
MRKICILSHNQFGYHIDSFNYCKYLRDNYEVHYISYDFGNKKIKLDDINIYYIKKEDSEFLNRIKFIWKSINYIYKNDIDLVFDIQIPFSFLYKLFFRNKKIIYDVRSLCVSNSKLRRSFVNNIIKLDSKFFKYKTIIDSNLAKQLNWNKNDFKVLMLGADKQINSITENSKITFIYVGTFTNRNIDITLKAFNNLIDDKEFKDKDLEYLVIGSGSKEYEDKIRNFIKVSNNKIKLIGYVENDKLKKYFSKSTVGISYIPMVDFYNDQPPTKTYEYLANGLICLATKTDANKNIINNSNGVLVNDDVDNVYLGMKYIVNNLENFNRNNIMKESEKFSWRYIVEEQLIKNVLEVD